MRGIAHFDGQHIVRTSDRGDGTSPESRTTDDEGGFREAPNFHARRGAWKYTRLTIMTKAWEREFAVERMRDDPTISYRALAKVLGTSDETIRRWRDEEGIHPRPHHNTGRRRDGTGSVPWRGKPARSVPRKDRDDDRYEDDDDDELPESDDRQDEEELETGGEVAGGSTELLAKNLIKIIERMDGLRLDVEASTPRGARRSPSQSPPSPTPADPGTRLRAITAELDARSPRGSAAVKLLVEAASYLTGGVTVLRQYGEARGCRPEDVAAAERAAIGAQGRRRPA